MNTPTNQNSIFSNLTSLWSGSKNKQTKNSFKSKVFNDAQVERLADDKSKPKTFQDCHKKYFASDDEDDNSIYEVAEGGASEKN